MVPQKLVIHLFEIIEKESKTSLKIPSVSKAGFKLENLISLKMGEFCAKNRMDYVNIYPPRYELNLPTFSGQAHQFDMIIQYQNMYLLGEIKRRKGTTKDQVRSFSAKLIDYGLGAKKYSQNTSFRGLFLSTANIPDAIAVYAIGCGITPIAPSFPPVEYLLLNLSEGSPLWKNLDELRKEMSIPWPSILAYADKRRNANSILESYKQYLTLWKEEGSK